MIPEAAVEAAARAAFESEYETRWIELSDQYQRDLRRSALAALEASAPMLMEQAWSQGATAGWKQSGEGFNAEYPDESTGECSVDLSANPYRPGK